MASTLGNGRQKRRGDGTPEDRHRLAKACGRTTLVAGLRTVGSVAMTALALCGSAGCRDLSRFSTTGPDDFYCGDIVDGDIVRRGFGPKLKLKMTFDVAQLDSSPGNLTTDDGLLMAAPMRSMPELVSDPLWTLEFGEGRDKNLLYMVDPTADGGGPSILAIVSLMHDGSAEVRLLRGAPALGGGPSPEVDGQPLFGVFGPLRRDHEACTF